MKTRTHLKTFATALVLGLVGIVHSSPAGTPTTPPVFSTPLHITNAYFPFQPGGAKVFTGTDGRKRVIAVDVYLEETRDFALHGATVTCRIMREYAYERGDLIEIADNYFAQSDDGTVYYFGEVVDNYEGGVVANHNGSWLVGGPQAGDPLDTAVATVPAVFMPGTPALGDIFKPEDLFPLVDETAEIVAVGKTVQVPAARFTEVIILKETTQLSPAVERKWYAPGVGVIMVKGKTEVLKLAASTLVQAP